MKTVAISTSRTLRLDQRMIAASIRHSPLGELVRLAACSRLSSGRCRRGLRRRPVAACSGGRKRLEGGFQVAFGIDQEIRADDDPLAGGEPFADLVIAVRTGTELDFARLEHALAALD